MSDHVFEWLGAYHDGELRGGRLHQVEQHLAECGACRAELDEIRGLSLFLQDAAPAEGFLPTERFVSNLMLKLPRRPELPLRRINLQIGWWLAPVGLLLALIFVNVTSVLSSAVSLAADAGLLGNGLPWVREAALQMNWFGSAMNLFGDQLSGPGQAILEMLNDANLFIARLIKPLFTQAILAIGYLGWLFAWWMRIQDHTTHTAQDSSRF